MDDYDFEELEYPYDDSGNMPCDTFGPLACTESCPKYYECHKEALA